MIYKNKHWIVGFLLLLGIALVMSCDKNDDDAQEGSELRSFSHLEAEKDSLYIGETTEIVAIYDGDDVGFEWESSSGDILGSGEQVTFVAAACTEDEAEINCTAKAENKSETRTIYIYVH